MDGQTCDSASNTHARSLDYIGIISDIDIGTNHYTSELFSVCVCISVRASMHT